MKNVSEKGIELIKRFEGFRAKPYYDSAKIPTIGYGTIRYSNGKKVTMEDSPISEDQAEIELKNHVEKNIVQKLRDNCNELVVKLNQNQFDAIVSLVYNIGLSAFLRSTACLLMKHDINEIKIKDAIKLWDKATVNGKKVKVKGLVIRRQAEADLYFTEDK